jgi:hypothetical protein
MAGRQMVPDAITLPDPETAVRALADISQQLRAACWTPNRAAAPTRLGFAFFPASD